MRAIAGLSVLVVVSLLIAASSNQSSTAASSTRPTQQPQKQVCKSARKAVPYYRSTTWQVQDELREARYRTVYPERIRGHCNYIRDYVAPLWIQRRETKLRTLRSISDPKRAICYVFKSYCGQALAVAWCESRYHTTSVNGQYLGLFQMGKYARSLYGHSDSALGQSFSAYAYFIASGRDWSPWSCQPN